MTHGDDFVVTGPTARLRELKKHVGRSVPNQNIGHLSWVERGHQGVELKSNLERKGGVNQHDPRHVDVLVTEIGFGKCEHGADSSSGRLSEIQPRTAGCRAILHIQITRSPDVCSSVKIELTDHS